MPADPSDSLEVIVREMHNLRGQAREPTVHEWADRLEALPDLRVTDQAVEAMCVSVYGSMWPTYYRTLKDDERRAMRAALEAALPHLSSGPQGDREKP